MLLKEKGYSAEQLLLLTFSFAVLALEKYTDDSRSLIMTLIGCLLMSIPQSILLSEDEMILGWWGPFRRRQNRAEIIRFEVNERRMGSVRLKSHRVILSERRAHMGALDFQLTFTRRPRSTPRISIDILESWRKTGQVYVSQRGNSP